MNTEPKTLLTAPGAPEDMNGAVGAKSRQTDNSTTTVYRAPKAGGDPRRQLRMRRRRSAVLSVSVPILLLAGWQLAATWGLIDVRFFPPPSAIFAKFLDLLSSGVLLTEVVATARRVAIGLPLGAAVGITVGLVCGSNQMLRAGITPIVTALYSVPKIAIYPLLLMILGFGEKPKIALVVIATGLIMTIGTMGAVASVPKELIEAGRAFRASRVRMFWEVIIPASLPQILVSLRIGTGMSILAVIATEFVEAEAGVGHLIWNSWVLFQPEQMYVGIAAAALLGVLFTALISKIGALLTPWDRSSHETRSYF